MDNTKKLMIIQEVERLDNTKILDYLFNFLLAYAKKSKGRIDMNMSVQKSLSSKVLADKERQLEHSNNGVCVPQVYHKSYKNGNEEKI